MSSKIAAATISWPTGVLTMPAFFMHFIAIPIELGAKQHPVAMLDAASKPNAFAIFAPIIIGVMAPKTDIAIFKTRC
jgi:hypothetical protein